MSLRGHSPSLAPKEITPGPASNDEKPSAEVLDHDHWYQIVAGYVDHAHTNKTALSAMFIDIDALKATNDELGHGIGNQLIDTVNRVITESVRIQETPNYPGRKTDVVTSHSTELRDFDAVVPGIEEPEPETARIGGDEFGILLPDTDREGANALAKRLREAINKELGKPENYHLAEIGAGISIGVSTLEPDMDTSSLLQIADRAMYADKLKQLRPLSEEEQESFHAAVAHLEEAGIRPRDVPKYIQRFGATAVAGAMQRRDEQIAAGQLVLDIPENGQADL